MNKVTRTILAFVFALAGIVGTSAIGTAPAQAKDPCFFSNAEWNHWKTQKNGGPGWGQTLGSLEAQVGCVGSWGSTNSEVANCPQDGNRFRTFRVWPQADGDQVWIGFSDYYPNSPRFKAHCEAGILSSGTLRVILE